MGDTDIADPRPGPVEPRSRVKVEGAVLDQVLRPDAGIPESGRARPVRVDVNPLEVPVVLELDPVMEIGRIVAGAPPAHRLDLLCLCTPVGRYRAPWIRTRVGDEDIARIVNLGLVDGSGHIARRTAVDEMPEPVRRIFPLPRRIGQSGPGLVVGAGRLIVDADVADVHERLVVPGAEVEHDDPLAALALHMVVELRVVAARAARP